MKLHKSFSDKGGLDVKKLIDFLDEDLLYHESFPEKYLNSVLHIFDSEQYWGTPSLWKLLHMLTAEALSTSQFLEISNVLTKNFGCYKDYMLSDMSCDFISRVCPLNDAVRLLEAIAKTDENEHRDQAVLVGVNVIKHRDDYEPYIAERLVNIVN